MMIYDFLVLVFGLITLWVWLQEKLHDKVLVHLDIYLYRKEEEFRFRI